MAKMARRCRLCVGAAVRAALAWGMTTCLLADLAVPAQADTKSQFERVRQKISRVPEGHAIWLQTVDQRELRGLRGTIEDGGFILIGADGTGERIAYGDVRSVMSRRTEKLVIVASILATAGIVALVIATHKGRVPPQ